MSFFVFTPKAEQMLKNLTSVGPRLPIYDNSGPRLPIFFTLGAGALPSYFTRGAGALHAKINKTHPTAGALIYIYRV